MSVTCLVCVTLFGQLLPWTKTLQKGCTHLKSYLWLLQVTENLGKKERRISNNMLTIPHKAVLVRQLDGRCERSASIDNVPCCWCHLYTFSCQCFSPGIIELPTIPVSTILSLPIILPFFSSLVLFHSSFSQPGKFEPRLHNHVMLKQSLNGRLLWEDT